MAFNNMHLSNTASHQKGQSMVEYAVILGALTFAMFAPITGSDGNIESVEDGVLDRQRGYTYALSLSAIPETDCVVDEER